MCRDDHVRLLHTADKNMWLYKKMNLWQTEGGVVESRQIQKSRSNGPNRVHHSCFSTVAHFSDCSTSTDTHQQTQTVHNGAPDQTVSIHHLKQNAGTICTRANTRRNSTLMYCKQNMYNCIENVAIYFHFHTCNRYILCSIHCINFVHLFF